MADFRRKFFFFKWGIFTYGEKYFRSCESEIFGKFGDELEEIIIGFKQVLIEIMTLFFQHVLAQAYLDIGETHILDVKA